MTTTTIDPDLDLMTLINVFEVDPARCDALAAIRMPGNRTDDGAVAAAMAAAAERWRGIDIVVNNAGIAQKGAQAVDTPAEVIDQIFAVNVRGIYHTTRHAIDHLRESEGTIINLASNAGLRPRPGAAWYNASKAAVINLTWSPAGEYAPARMRVNAIAPALSATQMMSDILGDDEGGHIQEAILATTPLGRLTEGSAAAAAATYLASDEASFVTGVILPVDGGRMVA